MRIPEIPIRYYRNCHPFRSGLSLRVVHLLGGADAGQYMADFYRRVPNPPKPTYWHGLIHALSAGTARSESSPHLGNIYRLYVSLGGASSPSEP